MTMYLTMDPVCRMLLLIAMFMLLPMYFYLCSVIVMRTKELAEGIFVAVVIGMNLCLLSVLRTVRDLRSQIPGFPPLVRMIAGLPACVLIAYVCILGSIGFFLLRKEQLFLRNSITRESIKEGGDNLPAGICFATQKGVVLLSNRCMNNLCYMLTENDLQDAREFWQTVASGRIGNKQQIRETEEPLLMMPDGSAWIFRRSKIRTGRRTLIRIIAVDMTEKYVLSKKLETENAELQEMNARLMRHSENVEALTREEEILATKIKVHSNMGNALLATRYFIENRPGSCGQKQLLEMWKRNVALLRKEAHQEKKNDAVAQLRDAAKAVGIKVVVDGEPPSDDVAAMRIILLAGRECITNAVRHAGASELYIAISHRPGCYVAVFTNDGVPPGGTIQEGGGLSGLRHRVESAGGRLVIDSEPAFRMTVYMPD